MNKKADEKSVKNSSWMYKSFYFYRLNPVWIQNYSIGLTQEKNNSVICVHK